MKLQYVSNCDLFVQILDMSPEDSIVSEPPHVRNWFPEYVFEVQPLDTMNESLFSEFEKKQTTTTTEFGKHNSKVKDIYQLYVANADHMDCSDVREGIIKLDPSTTIYEDEVLALKNRVNI
ncbi:PREDICTED: uncharacterized protein LOC104725807 [Camelina sativa]|uniref:Uncharacterized protein LOC104725807 n=1 Tax=Camelina sativa TaxID=90675 RepID=A0ABM0ULB8_CAMSA|nr:PREDICTED: uncharacterized protein LOC104725807 [Camelina sativa]XP_010442842.1 PREDICTED: uncharacterized protein LOC104725807 [Camelina sativa]XP_010442843.1 PREDICTED: uncharacterized protein LOC104725807 [Camelina sativa]XP_010442844.1 PREDICTED: uncharacterized protein LOC104725807 [Camelina sativa]